MTMSGKHPKIQTYSFKKDILINIYLKAKWPNKKVALGTKMSTGKLV